jgi:hypothetical protein
MEEPAMPVGPVHHGCDGKLPFNNSYLNRIHNVSRHSICVHENSPASIRHSRLARRKIRVDATQFTLGPSNRQSEAELSLAGQTPAGWPTSEQASGSCLLRVISAQAYIRPSVFA